MKEVARAHFATDVDNTLLDEVLQAYDSIRAARADEDHHPSLAEFLDAVAAVVALRAESEGDERWKDILEFTLAKPTAM